VTCIYNVKMMYAFAATFQHENGVTKL